MATIRDLLAALSSGGWAPDVQTSGVRPSYGLEGASVQPMVGSGFERTLAPGETRSASSIRDMLAEVILAAGSAAVPGMSGKGAARVRASRPKPAPNEPSGPVEYIYHGTNQERAAEIAASGKIRTFRPSYGTDQSSWPDGATRPRAYFTSKQEITQNFIPEGQPAILRVRKTPDFKTERYTNDIYTEKPIPAKNVEMLMPDGTWVPLVPSKGTGE